MNTNLTVGQTLFVVPINEAYTIHKATAIHAAKVISVGNKFFQLEGYKLRFHISTLLQCAGRYQPQYKCYLNKQDILDEREYNDAVNKIKTVFNGLGGVKLSLNQIREIFKIINK